VIVGELDLDLEAFEGPFDLLLTLVLKDELPAGDVDVAAIVVEFCAQLAERDELDLEACGEFLVLVAGLLELKVRALFGLGEDEDGLELDPDEAAADLAARLAEYRRIREAASWLAERLAEERFFRVGPSALAPVPARRLGDQDPAALGTALRALAVEPPAVSLSHMALRFPPVSVFLERFRSVLRRRSRFDFDGEVSALSRVEQAVAFLALLELRKGGEVTLSQSAAFAPIRVARSSAPREEVGAWSARSA
jgi:segregation and condensation protein A